MRSFINHLSQYSLFLGSRSPRRQSLLKQLGIPFTVWIKEETDESFPGDLPAGEVALYLARKKAESYLSELKARMILITADTTVIQNGVVLGKPLDEAEATNILAQLSGNTHEVITGICLKSDSSELAFSVATEVSFAQLEPEEITWYVNNYKPYDKAGSYGIQEWIGMAGIESIKGSYFNVMGLPVHQVYQQLKIFTQYKPNLSS